MIHVELVEKIVKMCDQKIAQKGTNIGLSFYDFFCKQKLTLRATRRGGHSMDSDSSTRSL